jgi:hypothetical protein
MGSHGIERAIPQSPWSNRKTNERKMTVNTNVTMTTEANPRPRAEWLIVDPKLPDDFDQRPNGERTRLEVAMWWDRPYALTLPDGGLEVRCLDGGCWDRSTWYGDAASYEEAVQLAARKLVEWQLLRARPVFWIRGKTVEIIQEPQHPFGEWLTVKKCNSRAEAAAWMAENYPEAE